jgi:hypothetical protein
MMRALPDMDIADVIELGDPSSDTVEVPKLDRWAVEAHVYKTEVSANIGILAGLFKGSGKHVSAGAMNEAKRYRLGKTEENRPVEIGVAVRLVAATTEWDASFDLSVPNIAAVAQLKLSHGDARVGIDVVGYSGPLGTLLPAPKNLDVSTLADYLAAFTAIQAQVFGEAGLVFLAPTVLAYDDQFSVSPAKQ